MDSLSKFDEAVNYIYDLPKFTTKHEPAEGREFLDRLGAPDTGMRIIHVAGTNGKGSVCAYMESILIAAGMKTGCFISPHLVDCRERIRLSGELCTEDEFVSAFEKVKSLADEFYVPTFFEYLFFMAMLIFKEHNCDIVILETGLGGRLDATNLVRDKLISVITSIGYDHCEYLGDSYEEIAAEKAGIICAGRPVIFWEDINGRDAIAKTAGERSSVEIALQRDVYGDIHRELSGIDFCLRYKYDSICPHIGTNALYQVGNAALAVYALLNVAEFEHIINEEVCLAGLSSMYWPARMEEIEKRIFLDGAHNPQAVSAFLEGIADDGAVSRMLIFGCMKDKDYRAEIGLIIQSRLFDRVICVGIGSSRAEDEGVVAAIFEKAGLKADTVHDSAEALKRAREYVINEGSFAYIIGSLYLAGEIRGSYND